MEALAKQDEVSMECNEVHEEDSDSFFKRVSMECVGVMPSPSEGLESLEDTLTESMLSPELPVGGDRGLSLTGEFVFETSGPKKSRLNLFTILLRGFGDVGLLSPIPSISHERA